MKKGLKKELQLNDIYAILPKDNSEELGENLEQCWNLELQKANENEKYRPSLVKAILKCFAFSYSILGLVTFMEECIFKYIHHTYFICKMNYAV